VREIIEESISGFIALQEDLVKSETMAPKNSLEVDFDESSSVEDGVILSSRGGGKKILSNSELMPDAGKVPLDPPELWGRGIIKDFKTTVVQWWVKEMTNFNQRTVAVTLLMFISVIAPTLTFG